MEQQGNLNVVAKLASQIIMSNLSVPRVVVLLGRAIGLTAWSNGYTLGSEARGEASAAEEEGVRGGSN